MSTYDPRDPTDGDLAGVAPPPPPPPVPSSDPDDAPPSGRHPVNISHLVMGLVFLTFVALWGLVQTDVVHDGALRFLLPIPWVVGGAVGLLVALVGAGRRRAR